MYRVLSKMGYNFCSRIVYHTSTPSLWLSWEVSPLWSATQIFRYIFIRRIGAIYNSGIDFSYYSIHCNCLETFRGLRKYALYSICDFISYLVVYTKGSCQKNRWLVIRKSSFADAVWAPCSLYRLFRSLIHRKVNINWRLSKHGTICSRRYASGLFRR